MSVFEQKGSEAVSNRAMPGMTHNTLPLLHEVRHALERLLRTGESTIIDLRAIPFGPGDEERLLSLLGEGEVAATLDALGRTTVRESRFSGVWIVDHYNSEAERIAFQLEVIEIPALLRAQTEDMYQSLGALDSVLNAEMHGPE
ncbi:hydrogenase expression/formation protein [Sedimenticola hydrogenitrophicus]|uniref:hydrogenase expression/formation protein n=1 Tax=Sedimenticola hydrogenitrophicus TaxID=2967975 RepID=UPI0021A4249E|nr:hydrogenase expression/formation protein [Sedimenticola hydrogenitrophicus]